MNKKNFILLLLCICMAFLMISCDNTKDPANTDGNNTAKPTETSSPYGEYGSLSAIIKGGYAPEKIFRITEPAFPTSLTLTTLQGLVTNLGTEQIIINTGAYSRYSKLLEDEFGAEIVTKDPNNKSWTTWTLVEHFKDKISGYILCSDNKTNESVNVAISLAKQLNAIAVSAKNEENVKELGLTCVLDVSDKDDAWLRSSEYFEKLNKYVAFTQSPDVLPKLADYAAMTGGYYNFYSGDNQSENKNMYNFMNAGGLVFGYNNSLGEHSTVNSFAEINLSMVPADHAHNLSTLSSFKMQSVEQKTAEVSDAAVENKHTVCFVMSDGDNMQWFVGDYATSTKWYASKVRGEFNMGWGMPPLAIDLSAPVMKYYYNEMTDKDNFIFELSGLGYTFPSKWTDVAAKENMAVTIADYMKRTDIGILEILDDYGQDLSKFKSTSDFDVFTKQDQVKGLFYIDYSGNYNTFRGEVVWSNNKPVVSAKYSLWATGKKANTPDGIAEAINKGSKDPKSTDSYSFVIVHAWSGMQGTDFKAGGDTMKGIKAVVDQLGDNVDVVTPDEFINRMFKNVTR